VVDLLIELPVGDLQILLAVHDIDFDEPTYRQLLDHGLDGCEFDVIAGKDRRLELAGRVEMASGVVDEVPKAEKEKPRVTRAIHQGL